LGGIGKGPKASGVVFDAGDAWHDDQDWNAVC